MVTVTIKYFAGLREAVGTSSETLKFAEAPTVAEVLDRIFELHPRQGAYRPSLLVAVNMDYADKAARVADGDEVALIPPVSGGAA